MLVALAVAALSGAGIATVVGRGVGLVLLITYFGGGALMCLMAVGLIRNRYSVAGIAWFMGTILTFNVWNILVLQLSFSIRWSGLGRWTFALVEVVSAIPLIVSVWLLHRRLRAAGAGSRGNPSQANPRSPAPAVNSGQDG